MNLNQLHSTTLDSTEKKELNTIAAQHQQTKHQFTQSQGYLSHELGKAVRVLPAFYTRILAGTITLVVFGTITWATFSQQEQVAQATGKTVPLQQVQPIHAPISGEIQRVVKENQRVVPGQVLFALKTEHLHREIVHLNQQMKETETLIQAVKHTSNQGLHHQSQALQNELKGINQQIRLVDNALELHPFPQDPTQGWLLSKSTRSHLKERAQLKMQRVAVQKNLNQIPLQDQQTRYGSLAQVQELQLKKIELQRQRDQIQHQIDQSTIKAPVAGTAFNVKTTSGQTHVQSGVELLTLSPEGLPLVMKVNFSSKDAPLIRPGMRARVKLDALEALEVKQIMGTVKEISPDSVEQEGQPPYFQATLTLDQRAINNRGKNIHLKPGMAGSVEIITGEKSVLSLLLEPITKSLEDSLK
ncbi:HlyD family efflux transporter periplasmic adaptor subunit [Acaryochloris sp. IP29b_bin.137]|uniref:HlyD family efflux transporter periplasmic adaptor subunit n=1 Tax=Acaryochloris sp. IP29b_bin.137 TaxID=2969217 RepID=UPI00262567BA|nr:HlyD family efflux transporter periplasmic adaptor subunit [Acaryochloris sp. IP29b_bin.137]